jgi:hypothetical protein
MTLPLQALAIGALIAGFVAFTPALLGGNAIEHFLDQAFTADAPVGADAPAGVAQGVSPAGAAEQAGLKSGATSENEGNLTSPAEWNWGSWVSRSWLPSSASRPPGSST